MSYVNRDPSWCEVRHPNFKKYSEKLADKRWKARRAQIVKRDNDTCQICLDETKMYPREVHHRYYIGRRMPWEYPDSALITLCAGCHDAEGIFSGKVADFEWQLEHYRLMDGGKLYRAIADHALQNGRSVSDVVSEIVDSLR